MEEKRVDNSNRPLRPLRPARFEDRRISSSTPPNRLTKSACLACRKRKSKCSGERPKCARCVSRRTCCLYDTAMPNETHTQTLKRKYEEVQMMNTTYKAIYEFLQAAPEPDGKEVFKRIRGGVDAETMICQIKEGNILLRAAMVVEESASSPCFEQLRSWKICHPGSTDSRSLAEVDESTILTLPPRPLDTYQSFCEEDTWTQIGWTKAHIRHLMDAVLTWDYLPFSLLCYDSFLQSFYSDSTRFCSSALVCAILALASRIVNEDNDDLEFLPSGWVGSRTFCNMANAKLQEGSSKKLPDMHATGILSLYHLRCGQEARAQECAKNFVTNISELCDSEPLMSKDEEQYARVRDITYCGALSLCRILLLATGQVFNMRHCTTQVNASILNKLHRAVETESRSTSIIPNFSTSGKGSQLRSLQFVSAKIFELTEWVYKFITSSRSSTQGISNNPSAFYKKCLDWYEEIFVLVEKDCGRTPFVLFVHMYYHFSLQCAFRPFIGIHIQGSDILPHKACKEAAQSILALTQSYDELFTLRRVSALIPYFVCSSGLLGLAMEKDHACMNPVHLRLGRSPPGNEARSTQRPFVTDDYHPSATSTYITMSATDHARQLLFKMSLTHPAAKIACNQL